MLNDVYLSYINDEINKKCHMNKENIIEVLNEWNFWNKDIPVGVERTNYLNKLLEFISSNKIISIIGIRRSGKSTLIKQLAKKLIENGLSPVNILIINFEEPMFENIDRAFLLKMYQAYMEIISPNSKPYIFLDEVQNVKGWERFVRSLQEKNEAYIIVTGSSSKLLSEELATVLTGRQLYFEVFPLSFQEFVNFRNKEIKNKKDILLNSTEVKRYFREYLQIGGFPEIVLNPNEEFRKRVLVSYYEDIINRDIVNRFSIKKVNQLKALVRFYVTNIASPISFNSISKFIKLPVETIRRYSSYVEISNLIFFIKRFSFSIKEQENSARKVYSIDTGLSNRVGFKFSEDRGRSIENMVAIKLKTFQMLYPFIEIYYWKNHHGDKEVDFVVKEKLKVKKLIQVCWDLSNENTKKREINALLKAMDECKIDTGYIITEEHEDEESIKGKKIIYIPLWKWLYEDEI